MSCPADTAPSQVADLFFGFEISGKTAVSEAQWSDFLAREVTPRFADGLTVVQARGQWRGASGAVESEESRLVRIVLPGRKDDAQRLEAVRSAYKSAFSQESVLLVVSPACAGF